MKVVKLKCNLFPVTKRASIVYFNKIQISNLGMCESFCYPRKKKKKAFCKICCLIWIWNFNFREIKAMLYMFSKTGFEATFHRCLQQWVTAATSEWLGPAASVWSVGLELHRIQNGFFAYRLCSFLNGLRFVSVLRSI